MLQPITILLFGYLSCLINQTNISKVLYHLLQFCYLTLLQHNDKQNTITTLAGNMSLKHQMNVFPYFFKSYYN